MTTLQLIEAFGNLRRNLRDEMIIGVVNQLAGHYPQFIDDALKLEGRRSQDKIGEILMQIDRNARSAAEEIKEHRPGAVFIRLNDWMQELSRANKHFAIHSLVAPLDPVIEKAQGFFDAYEAFIGSYQVSETRYLIVAAHELRLTIITATSFIDSLHENLTPAIPTEKPGETMSLILSPPPTLHANVVKLQALESMYEELCRLLDISSSEHPLEVIKIESGSLWTKVFGESKVIELMADLIKASASYLHRNFTKEGKIQSIPRTADSIIALLNLSDRLAESGVKSDVLQENLKQSAVVLAKQLTTLLAGEPKVTVNDDTYSVAQELEKRFLNESRTLFLGDGEETSLKNERE